METTRAEASKAEACHVEACHAEATNNYTVFSGAVEQKLNVLGCEFVLFIQYFLPKPL